MCPQFVSVRRSRLEVEDATNEREGSRTAARSTGGVNVRHLPRATVSSCAVDELRCEVYLGVVRPRVVLWVVLEWTGGLVDDRDGHRCRG